MSDFDREAERERLREKYERDQEKRESTERMSDLLLKGATMTDAHCGNCGDPIFRYDGEEFCPTCQERVESVDDATDEDTPGETGADSPGSAEEDSPAAAGTDARAAPEASTGDGHTGSTRPRDGSEATQQADAPGHDANGVEATASEGVAGGPARPSGQDRTPPTSRPQSQPGGDAADELGAARASLTRTLLAQAQMAENCEDPRRASDHLAAAREAAEALAVLSY